MDIRFNDTITTYRSHNSCETTLLRLVENWKAEFDRKNIVGVLASDMSKAFDSVCQASYPLEFSGFFLQDIPVFLVFFYKEPR